MKPVTLALCGAGNRGLQVYGRFAEQNPSRARVVAVAEPRDDHRQEASRRHDLPPEALFTDWRQLAAQPRLADAVVIATQDRDHGGPTLAFLDRGYHLLLEKPMAPTESECRQIARAAAGSDRLVAVAHVLRYSPYFQKMKQLATRVGQPATVRHLESVNFWHQAHSYVRGNWRKAEESAPMLLAKSCHDLDILTFLLERRCLKVSSFGSLLHFRPENRPSRATERCLDCPVTDDCPYSASRYYLSLWDQGCRGWPLDVLCLEPCRRRLVEALRRGPYGRCVYACDNDVVDHQVVAMEFENRITATFTLTAFTEGRGRETEILGSHGQLRGDGRRLELTDFASGRVESWDLADPGGIASHGLADLAMMDEFLKAVTGDEPGRLVSNPEQSLHSHLMAFAAEKARRNGAVVRVDAGSMVHLAQGGT